MLDPSEDKIGNWPRCQASWSHQAAAIVTSDCRRSSRQTTLSVVYATQPSQVARSYQGWWTMPCLVGFMYYAPRTIAVCEQVPRARRAATTAMEAPLCLTLISVRLSMPCVHHT